MITNELGLPQPFVDAVTSDYKPTEGRYSVTRTLGGTCEAVLLRRHGDEIDSDVADMVWAVLGSAVHKILEDSKETDDQIKENWISVDIDDHYTLSGIFDLYDDSTGVVTDYKTCGTIKVLKQEFDDYREQTLAYCWMLRKLGFNARSGEIVMILRDWVKSKARFDKEYPQHQVQKVSWEFSERDFSDVEKRIRAWFDEVREQEKIPDHKLKPCTPKQRWHKDDTWAVTRNGAKRATRLFGDEDRAKKFASELENKTGNKYHIEYRRGEDTKCEMYCSVAQFCPFANKLV